MGRSTYSMWITNKVYDASVYKLLNFIFNTKNEAIAETEINLPFGPDISFYPLTLTVNSYIIKQNKNNITNSDWNSNCKRIQRDIIGGGRL